VQEAETMLFTSLFLGWILLILANLVFCRPQRWPAWPLIVPFVVCGIAFTIGPVCLFFLPPVALEFVLLGAAMIACTFLRRGPRYFVPFSGLATMVAFGIPLWFTWQECSRPREKYPYETMEQRLPMPGNGFHAEPLPEEAAMYLTELEESIGRQESSFRARQLRRLHEDTVTSFVNSPGFGVSRVTVPTEYVLAMGLRNDGPIPQPGAPSQVEASPGELERETRVLDELPLDLHWMHENSVSDFAHAGGFGFFKDRRHVAGFEPHRFSSTPESVEPWRLQTVDLVGLLMHEEPVVYVSSHLPRMDELREAPTRPLDAFESVGLSGLRRGDHLVVREKAGRLRMLGGIRAAKQCMSCHGCERGDLLGAFSYTLRRDGR
jgi:hypothetical protein